MRDFDRRLDRLEKEIGSRRCATCAAWPEYRVEHNDYDAGWSGRRGLPAQPPAVCPGCGFEPATLQIVYVDNWRGEGRP